MIFHKLDQDSNGTLTADEARTRTRRASARASARALARACARAHPRTPCAKLAYKRVKVAAAVVLMDPNLDTGVFRDKIATDVRARCRGAAPTKVLGRTRACSAGDKPSHS